VKSHRDFGARSPQETRYGAFEIEAARRGDHRLRRRRCRVLPSSWLGLSDGRPARAIAGNLASELDA
jgi:hypothetical protein